MNPGRILVGLALIALGVAFLLDRLGVVSAGRLVSDYWPLIIVAAGVLQLVVAPRAYVAAGITILVGVVLLAASLHLLGPNVWQVFWPVVLIAVGLLLLTGVLTRGVPHNVDNRDAVQAFAVFGGHRVVSQSQQFRAASLTALFGGVTLDLTAAKPAPEGAVVDVMTAFGGIEIFVPVGWRILLNGIPIFGGFSDKTTPSATPSEGAPELDVRGTALFGSVEVKHRS